jgi:predicted nucleic acid-binding protein
MDFPGIVLDASALLAFVLSDEEGQVVEDLMHEIVEHNGQILVPALFWFEVSNSLVTAVRRSRITADELSAIEADISVLPISAEQSPTPFTRQRIREFSLRHNLSAYDAAYLELAARYDLRLKTFDTHLLTLQETFDFIM